MEAETTIHGFLGPAMDKPQSNNAPSPPPSPHAAESPAAPSGTADAANCFNCSICLDSAADPVVTLCGHLYCWPCIYQWMLRQLETASSPPPAPWCPVCKSPLSDAFLVPLYGRGVSRKAVPPQSLNIPSRPSVQPRLPVQRPPQIHRYGVGANDGLRLRYGYTSAPVFYSTAGGTIGGIAAAVLPLVFGNDHMDRVDYDAPHGVAGRGGGRRMRARRWEREVERSLHQLWLFILLCAILCLLLF
uniref:E3 ubiquitin-protein ligase RMA n=1 Tax=Ananas comosus var. bracteatus TaxID=296719 RepID=A0A6V7NRZ7_ANACO|nr:unnamed protein product [Ananas comosus var. bracteatus]